MPVRYARDTSVVARKIGSELILVPIRQNVGDMECIYTLNEVAGRIWELIDGGKTVEDVVSAVTQEYQVDAQQAKADVLDFLVQMKTIGTIVEKGEGG